MSITRFGLAVGLVLAVTAAGRADESRDLFDGKKPPEKVTIKPTKFAVGKYVADDDPKLWGWVIFPPGFRAPALMELARRQAWTLKPAVLAAE